MKRINLHLNEYMKLSEDEQDNLVRPFVTLDGHVVEDHISYDNDYDQTFPLILTGVKNPSSKDRQQNFRHRRSYPKSLLPYRKRNWLEWYQGNNYLSEIMSKYSHLSAGLIIGQKSSNQLVSTFITLNWKYNPHDFPFYEDFLECCQRRCRANNYQGKWRLLSRLLQVASSKVALLGFIRENINRRELHGNYLPLGEKELKCIQVVISLFPVNHAQRKRGYKDKGSQKVLHEIHDLSISSSKRRMTRDKLLCDKNTANLHFLYGVTNPVWYGEEPESETNYRKKINRQQNQLRKKERDRINSLTSPVKTYTLSEEDRLKYSKIE